MKDKETQIAEMANDLTENLRLCAGVKLLGHQVETIAYELLKKYQPKLPEHTVVLSGEQCAEIVQDNYNIGYERGSKETAEKFIEECKKYKTKKFNQIGIEQRDIGVSWIEMPEWKFNEFIKQFGIEKLKRSKYEK